MNETSTDAARRRAAGFGPWRASLLLAIVAVGTALLSLPSLHAAWPHDVQRLAGATLCAYSVFVLLAWFPLPWLSRRIEAMFEDVVGEGQAGWYLAVALGHFALAQAAQVAAAAAAADSIAGMLRQAIVDRLVGFSVDTFMNALWASLWPVALLRAHDWKVAAALAAFAWCVWRAGRIAFGETPLDSLAQRATATRGPGDDA